jgi:endoglucanase
MSTYGFSRRNFIKTVGLAATAFSAQGLYARPTSVNPTKNPIPRWRGFNLLDNFVPQQGGSKQKTTEDDLKWMRDWGFDFVRVPMAYPSYINFDRSRNITPEEVYQLDEKEVDRIEQLVFMANKYGLHVSLNLHRAPGYCINAGFHEPYNLWVDDEALKAFCFHWEMWAKRFKSLNNQQISFDLVNEPAMREDMNNQLCAR